MPKCEWCNDEATIVMKKGHDIRPIYLCGNNLGCSNDYVMNYGTPVEQEDWDEEDA